MLSTNLHIHDGSSRNGGVACDKREVRALSLHVALVQPVSLVSLSQTWAIAAETLTNNSG
jgi:hypothetical protein